MLLAVIEEDIFVDEDGQTVDEGKDNSIPDGMYYQESAMRNSRSLWTNKIVPYEIDRALAGMYVHLCVFVRGACKRDACTLYVRVLCVFCACVWCERPFRVQYTPS